MDILLGDRVQVTIESDLHGVTTIIGTVVSSGFYNGKPDAYWVEIAGLGSRLYSDEVVVKKVG